MNDHAQVASYALGLLDFHEMSRFEDHLAECDECAEELEALIPVVGHLGEVEPGDVFDVDSPSAFGAPARSASWSPPVPMRVITPPAQPAQPTPDVPPTQPGQRGRAGDLRRIVPLVRAGRSRQPVQSRSRSRSQAQAQAQRSVGPPTRGSRRRRSLVLASAAAILGAAMGVGAMVVGPWASSPGPASTAVLGQTGQRLSGKDAKSGVQADVVLEPKAWGTLVSLDITDVHGPRTCRLVAVRTDGESEVLSTWSVPAQGYGPDTDPPELKLETSTALPAQNIAALRVQDVTDSGGSNTLVTLHR
jgi:hypothetical protein